MKKTARKILFLLFLGTFLIAAPAVVLYTAGYQINFNQMSLVKTGLFYISTDPKGAGIVLNEKDSEQESTAILKNIMPGEYTLRLEKEGYLPWEKKLEVWENETTFVQKAVLFLEGEAALKNQENFLTFALSQDGKNLALAVKESSWTEIWSNDTASADKKLLFRLPNNSFENIELFWTEKDNKNFLLVQKTKGPAESLVAVDQSGDSQEIDENFLGEWQRDANQFLFFKETLNGVDLIRRDQNGLEQTLASLPGGKYEFLPAPPSFVLVRNGGKIFLIDDRGVDQPILLKADAFSAVWNPQNQKQLLYVSDFELHIFDADKMTDTLLTRVSTPIIGVAWHSTAADIFYADSQNLYALELDRRGGSYQIFHLTSMNEIKAFASTGDGKTIYLVGTKDEQTGLFERRLQE